VFGYNSKVYYIITEGAGLGDGVARFPVTGNETVLDAIANINGLTQVSSKRIWIARPVPHSDNYQILPVDWKAVTASGAALTNYQIMPGDRVFVAEDKLVALDTSLAKLFAPPGGGNRHATVRASATRRWQSERQRFLTGNDPRERVNTHARSAKLREFTHVSAGLPA
jgi:hypothetical protein